MPVQQTKKNQRERDRRLAGMIAQIPEQAPPLNITQAVMQRIKPKRPSLPRRCLLSGRKLLAGWPSPAIWAGAALAGSVLIAAVIALQSLKPHPVMPPAGQGLRHGRQVTFTLDSPSAQHVALIGSFNQWNPAGYQMQRDNSTGIWLLTIALMPGQHTYSFLIDEHRIEADPNALWQTEDGFGGRNSTIFIAEGVHDEGQI